MDGKFLDLERQWEPPEQGGMLLGPSLTQEARPGAEACVVPTSYVAFPNTHSYINRDNTS